MMSLITSDWAWSDNSWSPLQWSYTYLVYPAWSCYRQCLLLWSTLIIEKLEFNNDYHWTSVTKVTMADLARENHVIERSLWASGRTARGHSFCSGHLPLLAFPLHRSLIFFSKYTIFIKIIPIFLKTPPSIFSIHTSPKHNATSRATTESLASFGTHPINLDAESHTMALEQPTAYTLEKFPSYDDLWNVTKNQRQSPLPSLDILQPCQR